MNRNVFFYKILRPYKKSYSRQAYTHAHTDEEVKEANHVSVFDVNIPSMKASGGIHLTGNIAHPPFR